MSHTEQQKTFMRRAIALSREKMDGNCGGPFGAVIVKDGKVIGEGWNKVTSSHDPTAHAEVTAIRAACQATGGFSLKGCEIYTSCEPCPMCLAAIYWARLDKIYYANTRKDAADIGFDDDFLYREISLPEERRTVPVMRLLPAEALAVFEGWAKKADKIAY
jgi:tRNA(Arg) A34 adenosine deaminase TadA